MKFITSLLCSAMLILICNISIGPYKLNTVSEVRVRSTVKEQTDTAEIELPKKIFESLTKATGKNLDEVFMVGMPVTIQLGYRNLTVDPQDQLVTEFEGYINKVNPNIPFQIQCEDEMWKLKRLAVRPKVFAKADVKAILEYACPGYKLDVRDVQAGTNFVIGTQHDTAAKVLKLLEERTGFKTFFRRIKGEKYLTFGNYYGSTLLPKTAKAVDLRKMVASYDLRKLEDQPVRIRAISMQPRGKALRATFTGDLSGRVLTLKVPGMTQSQLEAEARRMYSDAKLRKLEGNIEAFGLPYVQHGEILQLLNSGYTLQNDRYFVEGMEITFGGGGYRRNMTLGPNAS
jgi:hypothetical protein